MRHLGGQRSLVAVSLVALVVTACGGSADPATDPPAASNGPSASPTEAAWTPAWVDGVLQPLPDGFPSKPISIVVVDEAASDDGIYARQVQQAASRMSPVRLDISDRPDFDAGYGVWDAIVAHASDPNANDGYTMMVYALAGSVVDLLATPLVDDLGVSLDDANYVMTTEELPWLIIGRRDAPWGTSFEQMLEWGKANPGELRFITRGPGSASDTGLWDYLVQSEVEVNAIVGGSHGDNALTIGAGKGDVAIPIAGAALPFVLDEQVVLLSCTGNANPCVGPWEQDVPNARSVVGTNEPDPWGANRGLLVTPATPDLHRDWLAELVRAVTEDADFQAARQNLPGLTVTTRDHDETRALAESVMVKARKVLEDIGGLDPSVQ